MARRDQRRAAAAEVIDDRDAERAAFDRIGARADFVEQHQRRRRPAPRSIDAMLRDVRREGAQARLDRLLVADVGEQRPEHRQRAIRRPAGMRSPACAIIAQQPGGLQRDGLAAGVRPGDEQDRRRRNHLDRHRHRVLEQRVPRRLQLERAVGRQRRLDAVDRLGEARAAPAARRARWPRRSVRCMSAARAAERVGQREQDAPDLLGLLLLERDDVVVDLDGAERLEKQARAARRRAVHDARDAAAVLGLHDEDVAAVPLGDDLILQVFRRLLAAQVRLERAAQPRPLLAQALANQLQLRARVIDDLAGRVDLLARLRRLALERRGAAAGRLEQRKRSGARRMPARASSIESRKRRRARAAGALRARALRRRAPSGSAAARSTRAAETAPCAATIPHRLAWSPPAAAPPVCGSVDGVERASRSAPIGVSAKSG